MATKRERQPHVIKELGFDPYGPLSQLPFFPEDGDDAEWIYIVQRYATALGINVALWRKADRVERKVLATGPLGSEPLPEDEMKEVLSLIEKQDPSLPLSTRIKLALDINRQGKRVEFDWSPVVNEVTVITDADFREVCGLVPTLLAGSAGETIDDITIRGVVKTQQIHGEFRSWELGVEELGSYWSAAEKLLRLAGIGDLPWRDTGKRIRE